MFRNGDVKLRMLNGDGVLELEDLGGALRSPEKSSGVPSGPFCLVLARVMAGLGRGLPPKIPSSSLAELEFVDPSGEDVGGGEDLDDEHGDELHTGELVRDKAEMVVLGDSVTESDTDSSGNKDTPSSRLD